MKKHLQLLQFSILILILLTACTSQTPETVSQQPATENFQYPATWTPEPETPTPLTSTPASIVTLAATWTPVASLTLPASLTSIPTKDASFTPVLGYCTKTESACEIAVDPSKRWGWCQVAGAGTLPGAGPEASCGLIYDYSLLYPQTWVVDTLGAVRPNLLFDTGTGNSQVRLLQLPAGNLTLDTADQALLCSEAGDCLPVVSPDETIIRRRTRTYAGRDFLFLTSTLADTFITRYFVFLDHPTTDTRLYIIEIHIPSILADSDEYTPLLDQTEVMLGSLRPLTSVEVTPAVFTLTPTPEPSPTFGLPPSPTPTEELPTPTP